MMPQGMRPTEFCMILSHVFLKQLNLVIDRLVDMMIGHMFAADISRKLK